MESDKFYKIVFTAGSVWNFAMSIGVFALIGSLPAMVGIEPPRYPIFIYFNLMSVFFFGCIQWIISRDLYGHRSFVRMLVWAKLAMAAVLVYSVLHDAPAKELVGFLAPGVVVDVLFGLMFWRFLVFSGRKAAG